MIELRPINNPPTTSLPLVGKPRPAYIRDKFLSDGEQKYSQPSAFSVYILPCTLNKWVGVSTTDSLTPVAHTDSDIMVVIEA